MSRVASISLVHQPKLQPRSGAVYEQSLALQSRLASAQRSTMLKHEEVPMDMAEEKSRSVATIEDVQRDLGLLRDDVSRLTQEVTKYFSTTGRKALRDVDDAVRERPLAAVAIATGLGLVCGALWRR